MNELQPPIEDDKETHEGCAVQRGKMIQNELDNEEQNTSPDKQGRSAKVSNANRFKVLGELGQTTIQGGVLVPDPIQHPP